MTWATGDVESCLCSSSEAISATSRLGADLSTCQSSEFAAPMCAYGWRVGLTHCRRLSEAEKRSLEKHVKLPASIIATSQRGLLARSTCQCTNRQGNKMGQRVSDERSQHVCNSMWGPSSGIKHQAPSINKHQFCLQAASLSGVPFLPGQTRGARESWGAGVRRPPVICSVGAIAAFMTSHDRFPVCT